MPVNHVNVFLSLGYSEMMSTHHQDDHSFLLFHTLPRSFWKSELILIVWLWWRLYLRRHGFCHIHYINLDSCFHVLSMDTAAFCPYVVLSIILDKRISCGGLFPCTTFYFPYFLLLSLHWIWLLLCLIWPRTHPKHGPLLREVPYVGYLRVSIPWSLRKIS